MIFCLRRFKIANCDLKHRQPEAAICDIQKRAQVPLLRPGAGSNPLDLFFKAPQRGQNFIEMDLRISEPGRRFSLVALKYSTHGSSAFHSAGPARINPSSGLATPRPPLLSTWV